MKFTRSFGMTDVFSHSRYELRTAVGMKVILSLVFLNWICRYNFALGFVIDTFNPTRSNNSLSLPRFLLWNPYHLITADYKQIKNNACTY